MLYRSRPRSNRACNRERKFFRFFAVDFPRDSNSSKRSWPRAIVPGTRGRADGHRRKTSIVIWVIARLHLHIPTASAAKHASTSRAIANQFARNISPMCRYTSTSDTSRACKLVQNCLGLSPDRIGDRALSPTEKTVPRARQIADVKNRMVWSWQPIHCQHPENASKRGAQNCQLKRNWNQHGHEFSGFPATFSGKLKTFA